MSMPKTKVAREVDALLAGGTAKPKKPAFKPGDLVTLSRSKRPIPAYGGKPFIGREDVLRVSRIVGTGGTRTPYGVVITDGVHFWHLEPGDVAAVEA